jgi:hypothetical protein
MMVVKNVEMGLDEKRSWNTAKGDDRNPVAMINDDTRKDSC